MAITGGFGMTMDLARGTTRQRVMGRDGVKRWADNGQPIECTWSGEDEPCRSCPRRISALHMCRMLQDEAAKNGDFDALPPNVQSNRRCAASSRSVLLTAGLGVFFAKRNRCPVLGLLIAGCQLLGWQLALKLRYDAAKMVL